MAIKIIEAELVKFEERTPTGAMYWLHRLSSEADIPCLTWGILVRVVLTTHNVHTGMSII